MMRMPKNAVLKAMHTKIGSDFQVLPAQNTATWLVGHSVANTYEFRQTEMKFMHFLAILSH